MNNIKDYPCIDADNDNRSAQVIQIDSGKHIAVVAVCAALCGMSLVLSAWSAYTAVKAERETRMQQYYLLELDAKVIAAGIKQPDDAIASKLEKAK